MAGIVLGLRQEREKAEQGNVEGLGIPGFTVPPRMQ